MQGLSKGKGEEKEGGGKVGLELWGRCAGKVCQGGRGGDVSNVGEDAGGDLEGSYVGDESGGRLLSKVGVGLNDGTEGR